MDFHAPTSKDFPENMPEEYRQHYLKMGMQNEDFVNQVKALFRSVDPSHIFTLRVIFHQMASSESCAEIAAHYEGIAIGALEFGHGRCAECGKDHASELLGTSEPPQVNLIETSTDPGPGWQFPLGQVEAVSEPVEASDSPYAVTQPYPIDEEGRVVLTSTDRDRMKEYNLDDAYDNQTHEFMGFVCLNCKQLYPSIEDRMLRRVDECSGCIVKSKWG